MHIEGFTAGGGRNPTKVYDLNLAEVRVAHVGASTAAGSDGLEYSLSLDYGKIALVTNGIDGSGKPVKNGEFAYDVTNHTEIAPFSVGLTPGSESIFSSLMVWRVIWILSEGRLVSGLRSIVSASIWRAWASPEKDRLSRR